MSVAACYSDTGCMYERERERARERENERERIIDPYHEKECITFDPDSSQILMDIWNTNEPSSSEVKYRSR